jgi:hypothetical protein
MKINKKYYCSNFFLCQKMKIQGLLHPAEANLVYFLACFQSLQLLSTETESPLAHKSHVSLKVRTRLSTTFFRFSYSDRDYERRALTVNYIRIYLATSSISQVIYLKF